MIVRRAALPAIASILMIIFALALCVPATAHGYSNSSPTDLKDHYVGTWRGEYCSFDAFDSKTGQYKPGKTYDVDDLDMSLTIHIYESHGSGKARISGKVDGERFNLDNCYLERGVSGNGYVMTDLFGNLVAELDYHPAKSNGSEDTLSYIEYEDDGSVVYVECHRAKLSKDIAHGFSKLKSGVSDLKSRWFD